MSLFDDPQELGAAIKRVRRAASMSHAQLAEATGMSKSTVVRWENGDEGKTGRTPQGRRSIAASVVEATGCSRAELGLSEPGASTDLAEIRSDLQVQRVDLSALTKEVHGLRSEVQTANAERQELHTALETLRSQLARVVGARESQGG